MAEESKERYAIVRVDNCPSKFEKGFNDYFVCDGRGKDKIICSNCRYGDTKEQLIRKVQQALFKSIFNDNVQKAVEIEEQKRMYKQYRPMAEKVVKFLGVE